MVIEKLEPSQHHKGRWLVWFEDGSLQRVGEGDVVGLGLYTGKELTDEEADALIAAGERSRMMDKAAELLALRPLSRKELLDKLTELPRKPHRRKADQPEEETPPDPETIQRQREALRQSAASVADRLEELGLINDRSYAVTVAQHYAGKGYGPRKIRDEMYRRGVPREYWDEAIEALQEQQQEHEESKVFELARQKLRGQEPSRENLKKVSDFLLRRGFGWEEISEALDRLRTHEEEFDP